MRAGISEVQIDHTFGYIVRGAGRRSHLYVISAAPTVRLVVVWPSTSQNIDDAFLTGLWQVHILLKLQHVVNVCRQLRRGHRTVDQSSDPIRCALLAYLDVLRIESSDLLLQRSVTIDTRLRLSCIRCLEFEASAFNCISGCGISRSQRICITLDAGVGFIADRLCVGRVALNAQLTLCFKLSLGSSVGGYIQFDSVDLLLQDTVGGNPLLSFRCNGLCVRLVTSNAGLGFCSILCIHVSHSCVASCVQRVDLLLQRRVCLRPDTGFGLQCSGCGLRYLGDLLLQRGVGLRSGLRHCCIACVRVRGRGVACVAQGIDLLLQALIGGIQFSHLRVVHCLEYVGTITAPLHNNRVRNVARDQYGLGARLGHLGSDQRSCRISAHI